VAELIDTHAHLDDGRFASDLPTVLTRAAAAGVIRVVTVATTAESTRASIALAERFSVLAASAGIHPNHAAEARPTDWDDVERLVTDPRVVAVGETGLDRHWDFTPFAVQEDYFARHLALARRHNKPIVIHCREAEADVLRMLRDDFERHGPLRGVMHSFAGSLLTMEASLAMGLHVLRGHADVQERCRPAWWRHAFLTAMVETDSPYLRAACSRARNEPAFVAHTAACLAEMHGVAVEVLAEQTTRNARSLFSCNPGNGHPVFVTPAPFDLKQ
jgi:TatD DNase family protein